MEGTLGRRPSLLDPSNPLHRFALELRKLKYQAKAAGEVAATCRRVNISRATYYAWLSGKQLPSRDALEITIKAWGGDVDQWLERRRKTEEQLVAQAAKKEKQRSERREATFVTTGGVRVPMPPRSFILHNHETAAHAKIWEAQKALKRLRRTDRAPSERSALLFLALLDLTPDKDWRDADRPAVSISKMMTWVRIHYNFEFPSHARDSIRCSLATLIRSGIVERHPRDPSPLDNLREVSYQVATDYFDRL
ncbi:hypothetical protein AB0B15_17185 [Streptomyces sp. NPDC045456]|uniref:hypothetical protein n=1 Tax=Streptomyces sp. NPDC045456 TaxID=3155254 RepID=UPI003404488A